MRILLLDIETAPNIVYTWGLRDQNISINQIEQSSYVMCYAAKWYGRKGVTFVAGKDGKGKAHQKMLNSVHGLLDEADVVVHYNGLSFDTPTLNKEFVIHGMKPPSPYKQVDLYRAVRGAFRFQSNKLDYVTKALDLGQKIRHEGQELWTKCMHGDRAAWTRMRKYNIGDVTLLEKLYDHIKPWIKGHPNHSAFKLQAVCPPCGSTSLQKRGLGGNKKGEYDRFQCKDCGAWSRGPVRKRGKPADYRVSL